MKATVSCKYISVYAVNLKWFAAKDAGPSDTGLVTASDKADPDMLGKMQKLVLA